MLRKSDACHVRVSPGGARFDPLIATQVFGAIDAAPPKAFVTEVITGVGIAGAVRLRETEMVCGLFVAPGAATVTIPL